MTSEELRQSMGLDYIDHGSVECAESFFAGVACAAREVEKLLDKAIEQERTVFVYGDLRLLVNKMKDMYEKNRK